MNGIDQIGIYLRHMWRLTKTPSFPLEYSEVSFHCLLNFRKRNNLSLQQVNKHFLRELEATSVEINEYDR